MTSPQDMPEWHAPLEALTPIRLDELNAQAALQDRMDTKYLVTTAQLAQLFEQWTASHRVLDVDGRRVFGYRTTYYDTDDLLTFREHVQRRRRRFKCRKRRYVDSGRTILEIKLKGQRGRTIKHARACAPGEELTADDAAFVRDRLLEAYGRELRQPLRPSLVVACRRITLASQQLAERVTCDVDLQLGCGRLADGLAVIETKSANGAAHADRLLREMGVRPLERFSKYLLGIAISRPDVRDNDMKPVLRRHVVAAAGPQR